jgi:hypothetical protein
MLFCCFASKTICAQIIENKTLQVLNYSLAKFSLDINDNYPENRFFSSQNASVPNDLPSNNEQSKRIPLNEYLANLNEFYNIKKLAPKASFYPLNIESITLLKDSSYSVKINVLKILSVSYTGRNYFKTKYDSDTLKQRFCLSAKKNGDSFNILIDSISRVSNNPYKKLTLIFIGKSLKGDSVTVNQQKIKLNSFTNEEVMAKLKTKKAKFIQINNLCFDDSILIEYGKQKLHYCDFEAVHIELSLLKLNDYFVIYLPLESKKNRPKTKK